MSIVLPIVDLTNANPGDTVTVLFEGLGITSDLSNYKNPAHLRYYNDSCMGWIGTMMTEGHQFYAAQGAWGTITIAPGETGLTMKMTSQMQPIPSVCVAAFVYYASGEQLDDIGTHGNTPQNIGGNVNVASANTLSNEGNSTGTEVIDIGPTGNARTIDIFNDHFTWSVVQSGVPHTVLQGFTSGNPLEIGEAGDTSEVLGTLKVDQALTVTGDATLNGAGTGLTVTNNETVGGTLTVTGDSTFNGSGNGVSVTNNLQVKGTSSLDNGAITTDGSGNVSSGTVNAVNLATNSPGGARLGKTAAGDCIDQTNTDLFLKAISGRLQFQSPSGTTKFTLRQWNSNGNAAVGSGTVISHGLATTPDLVLMTPRISQPGSATVGTGSWGSTTFTGTVGAGTAASWLALLL